MDALRRIRTSEWIFVAYFSYVALVSFAFPLRAELAYRPPAVAVAVLLLALLMSRIEFATGSPAVAAARDWIALAYVLVAYREMDWFTPGFRDYSLERSWLPIDHRILNDWGLKGFIESAGALIPGYLEFCYLLVYAIGPFSLAAFYFWGHRERANQFLIVYAIGALVSYALYPFFPSDPPRVVFPGDNLPTYMTALRQLNLTLVGNYGIHSSVFPSAHVSSAFAATWGLMRFLPEWPWIGRGMLVYAISVSTATVYGRYHYAADTVAGVAVSLIALAVSLRMKPPRRLADS